MTAIIFAGVDPFRFGQERANCCLASAIADGLELGFGAIELEHLVMGWWAARMTIEIPTIMVEEYVIEG